MNGVPVADPLCPSALHGELCSNLEAAKTVPGGPLQTDAHHTRSQCTFRDTLARSTPPFRSWDTFNRANQPRAPAVTMKATQAAC